MAVALRPVNGPSSRKYGIQGRCHISRPMDTSSTTTSPPSAATNEYTVHREMTDVAGLTQPLTSAVRCACERRSRSVMLDCTVRAHSLTQSPRSHPLCHFSHHRPFGESSMGRRTANEPEYQRAALPVASASGSVNYGIEQSATDYPAFASRQCFATGLQ